MASIVPMIGFITSFIQTNLREENQFASMAYQEHSKKPKFYPHILCLFESMRKSKVENSLCQHEMCSDKSLGKLALM